MVTLTKIAVGAAHKLAVIFSSIWGWFAAASLLLVDYFAGHAFVIFLIVAVTLMDAVWGIALSIKMGRFALSELARLTIAKLAVYGCAMFVFVGIDKQIDSDITASVVGTAIVLVEFWSSCGSMSVLFPDFLFLRVMRRFLLGEIARKLNIAEDEVEKALHKDEDKTEDNA